MLFHIISVVPFVSSANKVIGMNGGNPAAVIDWTINQSVFSFQMSQSSVPWLFPWNYLPLMGNLLRAVRKQYNSFIFGRKSLMEMSMHQ